MLLHDVSSAADAPCFWSREVFYVALVCLLVREDRRQLEGSWGLEKVLVGSLPNSVYLGWPHISTGLIYISCLGEVFVLHTLSFPRVFPFSYVVWQPWTRTIVGATPGPHAAHLPALSNLGKPSNRKEHLASDTGEPDHPSLIHTCSPLSSKTTFWDWFWWIAGPLNDGLDLAWFEQ